jgi:FKBP-type peptidyl-prolyl cis-trans isomerase
MAGANLTQWISVHALDTLVDYSWERRDLVERLGLPCISVFVDDEASGTDATPAPSYLADAARAVLSEVAAELRGRVVFLILKRSTSSYMMEDYGFGSTQPLPAVGISDSFDYDAPKFGYQGELLAAPLRAYVTDYLAGRLKPTIKSAPPPDEAWQLGTPQTVVGSTLEAEVVASEMDVLLCLHAPYSFEKLNATLHRLAMVVAPATMAKVATMDTMSNFFDPATFGGTVEKYHAEPVLVVWSGKGEERSMRKFKGKANLKTLLPFLKKHSTSLREHWPAVKRVLDADNAKLSAEKAAVAARVTQFKVTAEAATPTDVCCNGDGGVVKRIITEGRGEVPPKGSLIHAQYTGRVFSTPGGEASRLLEGPIFDSSRDRDQPFEFTLGQGQVISGWDRGFASMRVGERALLTLSPEYAYGGEGSGKIPASATLEFEVELLSFRTPGHEKSEL